MSWEPAFWCILAFWPSAHLELQKKKVHIGKIGSWIIHEEINPERPLVFYNGKHSTCSVTGDHPYIDMDICPKCNEVRIEFDCPREGPCQKWSCRGCLFCIVRCKECGGCISLEEVEAGDPVCPDSVFRVLASSRKMRSV